MKRKVVIIAIMVVVGMLLYRYLAFDQLVSDAEAKIVEVESAILNKPSADSEAVAASLQTLKSQHGPAKAQPIKKAAPKKTSAGTRSRSSEVVSAAPQQSLLPQPTEMQPTVKSNKDSRWIKSLSGRRASLGRQHVFKQEPKCVSAECVDRRPEDYAVVGVVVQTRRLTNSDPLMDGELDMGDAQKSPLVHMK